MFVFFCVNDYVFSKVILWLDSLNKNFYWPEVLETYHEIDVKYKKILTRQWRMKILNYGGKDT